MKKANFMAMTLMVALTVNVNQVMAQDEIKESRTGICHAKSSRYYDDLIHVAALHASLNACFTAGGRPPKNDVEASEAYASYLANRGAPASEQIKAVEQTVSAKKEENDIKEFGGFRLGVGIAFTGVSETLIEDVAINNGVVQVQGSYKNRGALMLEGHKFLIQKDWTRITDGGPPHLYGQGPFFAVTITDEEGADPFSAYGAGWMWGWKQKDSSNSWNLGIGYYVNTDATVLRDGLQDGGMTTETDPSKLLKTVDEEGWMLIFSTTW